ncbi:sugar nucleotide-binding protein [Peloplasma aerotolerans]|uniref:dTDP-4-dehydrorhamnose reductase n=1 Tax=Peloplasma aerotolerans TaxID=3044389 RepID=A0AAW6UB43_9MOLU|nr:sugar nucleotide-binding protein [Mariniplasma sp. M4Ah]MDI6453184.1 sugar nucleotide-binding protein [Mariniplasma sp. M4Ah]MDR4968443.1 sugar nucleotide-binding protein [Acholeplasmataceae bacterium]
MKVMITGLNGTVAPEVAKYFYSKGAEIIQYKREEVTVENEMAIHSFLVKHKPDYFLHFAMGTPEWAGLLAKLTKELNIPFVYISTGSVYSGKQTAPITIDHQLDAEDEYGLYKIASEKAVIKQHSNAYILRIGWQIGNRPGSNNMIDFLYKQMEAHQVIKASTKWYPSCSFMEDTAAAIFDTIQNLKPDTYLMNSNDLYSFYDIAKYLATKHENLKVEKTNDFAQDTRMIDHRVNIKKMKEYIEK